jgi:FtsP/CotA-like multicopper oxidase with cupredoxin domain
MFGYSMKRFLLLFALTSQVVAAERTIDLNVHYKTVSFAGRPALAIAVNDKIPAPTLRFQQGDEVTINVYNHLNEETALHWHGIIIPWQMDGVAGITQKGIKPGSCFRYQFTVEQSGTYWYHAHAALQEQQGVYGAFIIDPPKSPIYHYTKDYEIVLSDWSNTPPDQILANLKKEGDFYSPNFPMQPSLMRFIEDYRFADRAQRKNLIADYKMMQQMRMSIYDINDVAYDAFLLNGHTSCDPWVASVKQGDIVRLRFIGAGGTSIFKVKIPGSKMQLVQMQGNDVEPYMIDDFTIAPGETLDVLVKITQDNPTLIYAESTDQVGAVIGALVTAPSPYIDINAVKPFPDAKPVTREMMLYGMMHHGGGHSMAAMDTSIMNHSKMGPGKSQAKNKSQISKTKYKSLKAIIKTNDPHKPIYKTITMNLDGWMGSYIWFINGVPEHEAHPILFEPNKRYRFQFKNLSMMHHPMHIHGHWFILRNNHGEYDPLLHTIDMPPGATIIADLDTDASGQWLFHCHMLYHMMSGMARVFQYSTLIELSKGQGVPEDITYQTEYVNRPIVQVDELRPLDISLIKHPMAHHKGFYFSNSLDVGADLFNSIQKFTYEGLYGPDYHKLQVFINDAEIKEGAFENADMDIFYWRLIDQFWSVKGGMNYYYRPAATPYFQPGVGFEGMLPYFIETDVRCYLHAGSIKFDIEFNRDTQLTNNLFIRTAIRSILATDRVPDDEIRSGLNQMRYIIGPFYRVAPGVNLKLEYEHERKYGDFKGTENTLTAGFVLLF